MNFPWTRDELVQFVADYPHMQMADLMAKYNRSYRALTCKAFVLCVTKSREYKMAAGRAAHLRAIGPRRPRTRKRWTANVLRDLLAEYPHTSNYDLAVRYGSSPRAIACLANGHGVTKCGSYKSRLGRAAALRNLNKQGAA